MKGRRAKSRKSGNEEEWKRGIQTAAPKGRPPNVAYPKER